MQLSCLEPVDLFVPDMIEEVPDTSLRWKEDGRARSALLQSGGFEDRYMRIWNCCKVTIAQIHGHCLSGGCYIKLVCDIFVAAEDPISGVSSMPLW